MVEPRQEPSRFFVQKHHSLVPAQFYRDAEQVMRKVGGKTRSQVIDEFLSMQTRDTRIEPYTHNLYLVRTESSEASRKGLLAPSMFVKYRRCAREMAIEAMEARRLGGVLVTLQQLRSYLRGIAVHRLYYEFYAVGETEVEVRSEKLGIMGYIDEVRQTPDRVILVEVKSSYKPDLVGAGLQLMGYIYTYSDQEGLPEDAVQGVLLTLGGTYRVLTDGRAFEEYVKRVKFVLDVALKERLDMLPPRLPARLQHKCGSCAYRARCLELPDKHRTYQRYFEAAGFTRLKPKRSGPDLFSFAEP